MTPESQGGDWAATIDRLKDIASQSAHSILTDGPVHPDHELLEMCAEAMHSRKMHDEHYAIWRKGNHQRQQNCVRETRYYTDPEVAACKAELKSAVDYESSMRRVIFKVKKIRATTAAGVYAKALIVRSSRSGATLLAMSLAEDLIDCPGLRESLWPAAGEK